MRSLRSIILCGTMLVPGVAASAQTLKAGVATVVRIEGEARFTLGDGNWHPLVVGKELKAGTVIETRHGGSVDLVLGKTVEMPQAAPLPDRIGPAPDANVRGLISYKPAVEQNMVRLTGDTMMAIDKLTVSDTGVDSVSDTELDLWQGRIFCSVKKLSAASQYLIKIPNGIAGVRGTLFEIDASGWCGVLKNSVVLAITGPHEVVTTYEVGEGNQFNPETGEISPLPSDLLGVLHQIATALDTAYVEILSFEYDQTLNFISPTAGLP